MDRFAAFLVRNQIRTFHHVWSGAERGLTETCLGMSLSLIALLAATHLLVPQLRPWTTKFYAISYFNPETGKYGKGLEDLYLVLLWIVVFTFLRSFILDYVMTPLARRGGISTQRALVRFSEQAWMVVYYSAFWMLGMVCIQDAPLEGVARLTPAVPHVGQQVLVQP